MKYIKKFQKENNLVPDGIIGENTLRKMQKVFKISSNEKLAHFLAQLHHESGRFRHGFENLNYSAKSLRRVFSMYFSFETSIEFSQHPEKIANYVYGNRLGNGDEDSGDGWKYRGRGSIQITGRDNYQKFTRYIGDPAIMENPDLIVKKYYFEVALWFFEYRNLWRSCEVVNRSGIRYVSRRINGGDNGMIERFQLTYKYYQLIKDSLNEH